MLDNHIRFEALIPNIPARAIKGPTQQVEAANAATTALSDESFDLIIIV